MFVALSASYIFKFLYSPFFHKKNYAHTCVYLHSRTSKKCYRFNWKTRQRRHSEGSRRGDRGSWNRRPKETVGSDGGVECIGTYKLKPGWYNDDDNKATFNGWSFSTFFGFRLADKPLSRNRINIPFSPLHVWRDSSDGVHFVEGLIREREVNESSHSLRLDHCPLIEEEIEMKLIALRSLMQNIDFLLWARRRWEEEKEKEEKS